jgi:hypothetical protein
MWIDLADAIKIYARMCRARYGAEAPAIVLARAEALRHQGDFEGANVFERVAVELSALERAAGTAMPRGGTAQTGTANAARETVAWSSPRSKRAGC